LKLYIFGQDCLLEFVKSVDKYFLWGEDHRHLLSTEADLPSLDKKLLVVGHPRHDKYLLKASKTYSSKIGLIGRSSFLNPYDNRSFIDFVHASYSQSSWSDKLYDIFQIDCPPLEYQFIKESLDFYICLAIAKRLSESFDHSIVIEIRPHPRENWLNWSKLLHALGIIGSN